jgi:hypothetical protein
MSLLTFISNPEVRKTMSLAVPKPRFVCDQPMLAPPLTTNYALVGTAFDYLLRFYLELINPQAIKRRWIAEEAAELIPGGTRLSVTAHTALKQAHYNHQSYMQSGVITDDLISSVLQLAYLDNIYRSGVSHLSAKALNNINPLDIADLRRILSLAKEQNFKAQRICLLNPTFGNSSLMVGGADADLIVDNCLIDIKTTKHLALSQQIFNQLLGYYILLKLEEEITQIMDLCVYFSRHGYLHRIPITQVMREGTLLPLSAWFVATACGGPDEVVRYTREATLNGNHFVWQVCQHISDAALEIDNQLISTDTVAYRKLISYLRHRIPL